MAVPCLGDHSVNMAFYAEASNVTHSLACFCYKTKRNVELDSLVNRPRALEMLVHDYGFCDDNTTPHLKPVHSLWAKLYAEATADNCLTFRLIIILF